MRRRTFLLGTLAILFVPWAEPSSRLRNCMIKPDPDAEPVILLHGLWMRGYAMVLLARRLRTAGFAPEIVEYFTLLNTPEKAAEKIRQRMLRHGDRPVHLVGHSLGGLVSLLATRDDAPAGRTVCLGSPLRGSQSALRMSRFAPVLIGKSGRRLIAGLDAWTGAREVGVIAGNVPRGLGRIAGRLDGENDGTVTVTETKLPGITDHLVMPSSHTGLPFSAACADQVIAFLRTGRFTTML
jgi:pimeloyl-ACP methyl ester carboxylesterase